MLSIVKKNGINYKLLNIYSKNELEDIIGEFYLMYDEDDFFNIVENLTGLLSVHF